MWKLKNLEYFIPIHCIICSLLSSLQDIDRMFGSWVNVARNKNEPTEVRKKKRRRKHVDQISAHSNGVDRGSNLVLYCIWNINVMLMCGEMEHGSCKQMGESQGKSENDFHYSLSIRYSIQSYTVFAHEWNAHMNSLWHLVMILSVHQQQQQ